MISFKEYVNTTIPMPVRTPVPLNIGTNIGQQAQQAGEQASQQTSVNLSNVMSSTRDSFNRLRTGLDQPVEVQAVSLSPSKHMITILVQGPNLKWSRAKEQIFAKLPKLNITY